jgi:hypothetical protein
LKEFKQFGMLPIFLPGFLIPLFSRIEKYIEEKISSLAVVNMYVLEKKDV